MTTPNCLGNTTSAASSLIVRLNAVRTGFECCSLVLSLLLNSWLLGVSRRVDGIFKYPLCYVAFCDILSAYAKLLQLGMQIALDPSTYLRICRLFFALLTGSNICMLCALVAAPLQYENGPLQRCLVFYDTPLSSHAETPRSMVAFCVVLFLLSSTPTLGMMLATADRCLNSDLCPDLPANAMFNNLQKLTFVSFYPITLVLMCFFVLKVFQMKSVASFSTDHPQRSTEAVRPAEIRKHYDFLKTVVVQTTNPILLTTPVLLNIVLLDATEVSDGVVGVLQQLSFAAFQLNPLVDALSTIYFIVPYRKLATGTIRRICSGGMVHEHNIVSVTPAPVNQADTPV